MYAKLNNDGTLTPAPKPLKVGELVILNPTKEQWKANGFKDVVQTYEPPQQQGFYTTYEYVEKGDYLVQTWRHEPMPEDMDIPADEALSIITGGQV